MGDGSSEGPVGRILQWAYAQPDDHLRLIHIRDWHDPDDSVQADHLRQFGAHCLHDTPGASFAFDPPLDHCKDVAIVNSTTLNDFIGTTLSAALSIDPSADSRLGLMGVWTEAKITFLAYELRSRFPDAQIAVCPALTASSSRSNHFFALDQLRTILGVILIESVGEFIEFLGGTNKPSLTVQGSVTLDLAYEGPPLDSNDEILLRYLFRDCRHVHFHPIGGGFSGSKVLACQSEDGQRRMQAPCVLKIGPRKPIAQERMAFEQIEAVLGNVAPSIDDYADFGQRGAIRYRYASMDFGAPSTLQKRYQAGLGDAELSRMLDIVFLEQLGRLYAGAEHDAFDLLAHYGFSSDNALLVRKSVSAIVGTGDDEILHLPGNIQVPNPVRFYEQTLPGLPQQRGRSWWRSWVHGDLNGANIVIDSRQNVWIIDFSRAGRAHVLSDLVKLENDLLYIWSQCSTIDEFSEGTRLLDAAFAVEDLAAELPTADEVGLGEAGWRRAWNFVRQLRSYYPALIQMDRDPLQLFVAQLRYAAHTMSFSECNLWQKRLALYGTSLATQAIEAILDNIGDLRIDWLKAPVDWVGITLLPGRRDHDRDIEADLDAFIKSGVTHVLSVLTIKELEHYGVPNLNSAIESRGLNHLLIEVIDQKAATPEQFHRAFQFIDAAHVDGGRVVIHCVGGLGRSGMIAAGYLLAHTESGVEAAMASVRSARSRRAIETQEQEHAIMALDAALRTPPAP